MNKTVITALIALVIVAGGGFVLIGDESDQDSTDDSASTAVNEQETTDEMVDEVDLVDEQMSDIEPQQQESTDPTTVAQSETESDPEPTVATQTGQYIEYSDGVIEATAGTKILFFHADWCVQCRTLENDIKRQGVPDSVSIIEVDFDNQTDLKQKYGVTLQTTLVKVDDQGNEVAKYGAYSTPTLQAVIDNLL